MKSKLRKQIESDMREDRKAAGFFDGRFRTRVQENKRKKEELKRTRGAKKDWESET
jgi:hypothetical protein